MNSAMTGDHRGYYALLDTILQVLDRVFISLFSITDRPPFFRVKM